MAFRIRKGEIAAHQQQHADNCHFGKLGGGVNNAFAAPSAEGQHERTGDGEPHSTHQRRRNVFDRNINREIG